MELDPRLVDELVDRFLTEDIGRGDITSSSVLDSEARSRARIEARESCVVAGLPVAHACFHRVAGNALEFEPLVRDGQGVDEGAVLARLAGPTAAILTAERTALNVLQRLSGVATQTRAFVDAVAGTDARIIDTRKTTPGLRVLEKYAVALGGGHNHRSGLDDGVLIKDNHLAAIGGDIFEAVARARSGAPATLKIEIEVSSVDELQDAISAGADIVLLDNFSPEEIRAAVQAAGGKVVLEASGGVTLDNVADYATAGVDLISVGALTHSARAIDLALEVEL